jgi:hypothetical protein
MGKTRREPELIGSQDPALACRVGAPSFSWGERLAEAWLE